MDAWLALLDPWCPPSLRDEALRVSPEVTATRRSRDAGSTSCAGPLALAGVQVYSGSITSDSAGIP
jgi:hypothetical protein